MYKVIGGTAILFVLTACGSGYADVPEPQTYTLCLEEQEANGVDYMVNSPMSVCDSRIDDVELFESDQPFNIGDVVYVEVDSSHSKSSIKNKTKVNPHANPPAYVPVKPGVQQPKICLKSYSKPGKGPAPAPKPPAPAPAPAPVAPPKPVQPAPAPVVPKPVQPAPQVPTVPKAPVPAPTIKPGC